MKRAITTKRSTYFHFGGRCFVFAILFMTMFLIGCDKANSYSTFSRKYRVYFNCDLSIQPFSQVSSPGRFVSVRINRGTGALVMNDIDGNSYSRALNQTEANSFSMGLCGLILGTPTLGNDAVQIWAYDLGCPICDRESTRLSLTWDGHAECKTCKSIFDLNNNGIIISSQATSPRPLYRYPVNPYGTGITVAN